MAKTRSKYYAEGLSLIAIVPLEDIASLTLPARGLRLTPHRSLCAVIEPSRTHKGKAAALRRDRIVRALLYSASAVLPFRLDVELRYEADIPRILAANEAMLLRQLKRLRGRVEMGIKARLIYGPAIPWPALEPVRSLTPFRQERILHTATAPVFEGCYLVERTDVERFWAAVERLRQTLPDMPVLGTGPWAPYSFSNLTLSPGDESATKQETAYEAD